MAEIPIPTAAEAGQGIAWFTDNTNIATTILALLCVTLIVGVVFLFKHCKGEMEKAWVRVTAISEARSADALATVKALADNSLALSRVADRVDISDRRSR